jgi:hypothetical protein
MVSIMISGGQTGADRAALDFALANRIAIEGYCPQGRRADDGPLDMKYPLHGGRHVNRRFRNFPVFQGGEDFSASEVFHHWRNGLRKPAADCP